MQNALYSLLSFGLNSNQIGIVTVRIGGFLFLEN